jgi:hypothetical protein
MRLLWIPRRGLRESAAVLLAVLSLACERSTPAAGRKDTAVTVVPPRESSVVARPEVVTWDSAAGPALFVAGATPQQALVIAPRYTTLAALDSIRLDTSVLQSLRVELFGTGKQVGTGRIVGAVASSSRTDSCRSWPTARLEIVPSDTGSTVPWNVAFETGHASGLVVDSIEGLPTADSARLAADIARLASALPGDTAAVFRGLPFVVTKAWRTRLPTGPVVLTAVVVRNVNQEANPRQERILLIAERDTITTASQFTTRYAERIAGPEETLEATDPIAIVLLGTERRPTIVVTRDAGNGLSYALIERNAGQWRQRWASTYAGC